MTYKPNPYTIQNIKQFTEDVKLFRIKSKLNPQPGQFFELSMPGIGECPFASCSFNQKYIDILVRNAGSVTSALFKLKKGNRVYIRGAYGHGFPLEDLKGKNLILIAGGTGIAPITSLIEYIEQNRKNFGSVTIYFGFRDENYILLKEKIQKWMKRFKLTICLDKKQEKSRYKQGFVHDIMKKDKINIQNTLVLMCGPEIMMDSVAKVLNKSGLGDNRIYWSMERRMECGFGNCGRCLIQDVYVCKDGPVFRYDIIKPKLENENSANKEGVKGKNEK